MAVDDDPSSSGPAWPSPESLVPSWRPGELVAALAVLAITLCAAYVTSRLWLGADDWLGLYAGGREQAFGHHSDGCARLGTPSVGAYAIRGRRPAMEDRMVSRVVQVEEDGAAVAINAVLDGHGGQFSADFVRRHLLQSLESKIRLLKMLTSRRLPPKHKLMLFEMAAKREAERCKNGKQWTLSKRMVKVMGLSQDEYKQLRPEDSQNPKGLDQRTRSSKSQDSECKKDGGKKPTEDSLVLSSRVKPIEDFSQTQEKELVLEDDSSIENVLSLNTSCSSSATPKKKRKALDLDLCDYLSEDGRAVLYPQLLKDEVERADRELLAECAKNGHIGGTTLLLSVFDGNVLWVANVGDSRGVMTTMAKTGNDNAKGDSEGGQDNTAGAKLLSYDHKPSLPKEKKRIEEAGGFVAMNGVWRVQGILAVSRALGDLPLKTRKLITCEPDVLSFPLGRNSNASLSPVVVLASDGLWDVLSNEEAATMASKVIAKLEVQASEMSKGERLALAAKIMAEAAFDRGSMDNVTIILLKNY